MKLVESLNDKEVRRTNAYAFVNIMKRSCPNWIEVEMLIFVGMDIQGCLEFLKMKHP